MWYEPPKYIQPITDINLELGKLAGELEDEQAKLTLAQFLMRNIGFTAELLTGVKLYPDQLITIKGMMARNYTMCVWGRGVSKTFTAALYCILQTIFVPKTSILVAGPTFRTARFIFNHIEKLADSKEATLLAQALGVKIKRNDEFRWSINGGDIVAIPLNGEKIRGFRANVLLIDEFLLMSEEIVEKVLMPYLVAQQNQKEIQEIREKEDEMIARGLLTESQRYKQPYRSKLIALSSASYKCEYLYRKYDEFVKAIYSPDLPENNAKYFVSQMAWDSIHPDRLDKSIIELAQSNESNTATFKREYCAEFIDGSDSYFSMNKMIACTIPDGEEPTLLLKGSKEHKYILAIDPNFSNSATADHFAMCVVELDGEGKMGGTVVHSYAEAGKDLKDHIKYLYYLLTSFNIQMIIIDYAGYQFIEAANESELFRNDKIELKVFQFESEKDGADLEEQLKQARRGYNQQMQRIVFTQYFTVDFIRKGNEWLQGCIDYKKIWFGGVIKGSAGAFNKATETQIDPELIGLKDDENISDFIDKQEILLKQTKYQCASIEVKTTAKGTQSFDLPQIMKRDSSTTRMRRDSYTALMLACWCMKCYHDIKQAPQQEDPTFTPFFV